SKDHRSPGPKDQPKQARSPSATVAQKPGGKPFRLDGLFQERSATPPLSRRLLMATRLIAKNRHETEPQAGANRALVYTVALTKRWLRLMQLRANLRLSQATAQACGGT